MTTLRSQTAFRLVVALAMLLPLASV